MQLVWDGGKEVHHPVRAEKALPGQGKQQRQGTPPAAESCFSSGASQLPAELPLPALVAAPAALDSGVCLQRDFNSQGGVNSICEQLYKTQHFVREEEEEKQVPISGKYFCS